jgi:two-component system sensor histidine kinase GlrK
VYYPRSFLRFVVLGLALIGLPLFIAIGELIANLDRLSGQSERAVLQAAQAGRASRQLVEQTTSLERIVRQYLILDDRVLLDRLLDGEARLQRALVDPAPGQRDPEALGEAYASLTEKAQTLVEATNAMTDREIDRLRETAQEGREKWVWLTIAALAIAVVLAMVFAVLIARPIRQIEHGIRQMGTADFEHVIRVDGPQELRYLGQRLEWLRSRLHELEQQQTRFLRHVSHELKTPLTVVREGAELLHDRVGGSLSAEQDEIVRILRDNTLQLQKLIENLLRFQQTRVVESSGPSGPVGLDQIVRRVVGEQKLTAYAKVVTIETRLAPVTIGGDAEKLRVIVDNLVSNAIRFSPRGGKLSVALELEPGFAVLEVIDEGPGVDAEERVRIFDSFYQGKPSGDGRVKGSGLGLAIVREYVGAHGGTVAVGDRADGRRGARFSVRLPVSEAQAASTPERPA